MKKQVPKPRKIGELLDVPELDTPNVLKAYLASEIPKGSTKEENYSAFGFVFCGDKVVCVNTAKRGLSLPGGRAEAGESLLGAYSRELHEETGIIEHNTELIGYYRIESLNGLQRKFVGVFLSRVIEDSWNPRQYKPNEEILSISLIGRKEFESSNILDRRFTRDYWKLCSQLIHC